MQRIGEMPVLFLFAFRFVRLLLNGHQAIVIESAALRMQIAAFQRKRKRPLLTILDRLFGSVCAASGPTGDILCCMSSRTLSFVGNANGSADSGPGFLSRNAGVAVAPVPLQNCAD